jgi:hypothetical protein
MEEAELASKGSTTGSPRQDLGLYKGQRNFRITGTLTEEN